MQYIIMTVIVTTILVTCDLGYIGDVGQMTGLLFQRQFWNLFPTASQHLPQKCQPITFSKHRRSNVSSEILHGNVKNRSCKMQLIAVETFPTKKLLRFAHRCPCDSMSDCGMFHSGRIPRIFSNATCIMCISSTWD